MTQTPPGGGDVGGRLVDSYTQDSKLKNVALSAGVRHVGSDNPSAHMFDSLKAVLPNLSCLFLDATHLAMAVEKCRDGKHSATSRCIQQSWPSKACGKHGQPSAACARGLISAGTENLARHRARMWQHILATTKLPASVGHPSASY